MMNLQQAIEASDFSTAEYVNANGIYMVVDGSLGDGSYDVKEGEEGMPPRYSVSVKSLDAAIAIVGDDANIDEWEPVGEAES